MIESLRGPNSTAGDPPDGGHDERRRVNLWRLPGLVSVAARRVTFPEPRVYYVGSERRETRTAVELRVETREPIPARALTPVLLVGDTAVPDYTTEGANLYHYIAYQPELLEPNAPVRWGWPGASRALAATRFRFSLGSGPGPVAAARRRTGGPRQS